MALCYSHLFLEIPLLLVHPITNNKTQVLLIRKVPLCSSSSLFKEKMAEAVVLSPGGGFVRMRLCVRFGSLFFFRYGMNVPQMIVKAMTSSGV